MSDSLRSYNPILSLPYVPAFESLGEEYTDRVVAANFPKHQLRFRNDEIWPLLGLDPAELTDEAVIEAFAQFQGRSPFLAMRYHGYQFGEYNPYLGDGRGFLYGQVRGTDGKLYDFGTKGSGTTPYSRGGDGRLTLKGGVREVIAAEALYRYGVNTSRCLSMVETGEQLWRGDEPSPTRSSVMIRFSQSHIRFGTFERLHYLQRGDLVKQLLDHVIEYYYPHLQTLPSEGDRYSQFFAELVQRVATLSAQWMSVGFCHGVLNTDNMSITGESFDYGPYAFIEKFNPRFTAAYFDYSGRYSYGNQARTCQWNLELLQYPLKMVMATKDLDTGLGQYSSYYHAAYRQRMMQRLGFEGLMPELIDDLLQATLQVLNQIDISYHTFFFALRHQFQPHWRQDQSAILPDLFSILPISQESLVDSSHLQSPSSSSQPKSSETQSLEIKLSATNTLSDNDRKCVEQWRSLYHTALNQYSIEHMTTIAERLKRHNPNIVPIRAEIEAIWEPIVTEDNWQPFYNLIQRLQQSVISG